MAKSKGSITSASLPEKRIGDVFPVRGRSHPHVYFVSYALYIEQQADY